MPRETFCCVHVSSSKLEDCSCRGGGCTRGWPLVVERTELCSHQSSDICLIGLSYVVIHGCPKHVPVALNRYLNPRLLRLHFISWNS